MLTAVFHNSNQIIYKNGEIILDKNVWNQHVCMTKRAKFATLAISIIENLCLLEQFKLMEHNQNNIPAFNHQRTIWIKFNDHS